MAIKRSTYIIFMALAVFMLRVSSYVPHHHHDWVLCAAVEHCDEDDADNDEHTNHCGDATFCIEEEEFLISKSDTYHTCLIPHELLAPLAEVLPVNVLLYPVGIFVRQQDAIISYRSADVAGTNALRAPPRLFS